jgi:hypothetical protein
MASSRHVFLPTGAAPRFISGLDCCFRRKAANRSSTASAPRLLKPYRLTVALRASTDRNHV